NKLATHSVLDPSELRSFVTALLLLEVLAGCWCSSRKVCASRKRWWPVWSSTYPWRSGLMKFPRKLPHFRSLKFAPFALFSLFLFSNLTGILFSHVLAPDVVASTDKFHIPADIPTSGDPQLDRIIFEAGEHEGVDPRFIHAVIWQESKYD